MSLKKSQNNQKNIENLLSLKGRIKWVGNLRRMRRDRKLNVDHPLSMDEYLEWGERNLKRLNPKVLEKQRKKFPPKGEPFNLK